MNQNIETIQSHLDNYPFIKYYLEHVISQRLKIECYEYGMLTAHLLEPNEYTKSDLDRLEKGLQLGQEHCTDFQSIFQERMLTKNPNIVDGEIINLLAEVKAFEFLYNHGFTDIAKIKRKKDIKTVDFITKRNSQNYAIEVTRLGLATSSRKKPQLDNLSRPPLFIIIDSKENQNWNRIAEDIYDEIIDKYSQIQKFCQRQTEPYEGILIISNGRDYFMMGKYEQKIYELQPLTVAKVLEQLWQSVKEQEDFKYLNHIVITMGKDINKAIMYPELKGKSM